VHLKYYTVCLYIMASVDTKKLANSRSKDGSFEEIIKITLSNYPSWTHKPTTNFN
jgi:hypothetical protein